MNAPITPQKTRALLPEDERLLSVRETRARLGICPATLYKLFNSGALPSLTVGRSRKVRLSVLTEFMRTGTPEAQ